LFGAGPGQIPPGAIIRSATLRLNNNSSGDHVELHRMLVPWDESSTWNSLTNSIDRDDVEAAAVADAVTGLVSGQLPSGPVELDILNSLLTWQASPAANFGWVLFSSNGGDPFGNDVLFNSSESPDAANRPKLTVEFIVPAAGAPLVGGGDGQDSRALEALWGAMSSGGAEQAVDAAFGEEETEWWPEYLAK
jgi:hypothetical protein